MLSARLRSASEILGKRKEITEVTTLDSVTPVLPKKGVHMIADAVPDLVTNLSDSIESADQIDSAGGSQGVREQETAQDRTMDVWTLRALASGGLGIAEIGIKSCKAASEQGLRFG